MSFHPKMAYDATFHRSTRTLTEPGGPFTYTPENRARFDAIVTRYPPDRRRSAVLPALYLVQHQQGHITGNAMRHVAGLLGITAADVEDVVSYYTMFHTKAVGTFELSVCRTLSCALNGAERVTEEICGKLGIRPGETDATGTFTLDFYLAHQGYDGLKKALAMTPEQVVDLVRASGLRGRGGAGFPTGLKWQFVDKKSPNPK